MVFNFCIIGSDVSGENGDFFSRRPALYNAVRKNGAPKLWYNSTNFRIFSLHKTGEDRFFLRSQLTYDLLKLVTRKRSYDVFSIFFLFLEVSTFRPV